MFGKFGGHKSERPKLVDFDANEAAAEEAAQPGREAFAATIAERGEQAPFAQTSGKMMEITNGKINTTGERMGALFGKLGGKAASFWKSAGEKIGTARLATESFALNTAIKGEEMFKSARAGARESAVLVGEGAAAVGSTVWEGVKFVDGKIAEYSDNFSDMLDGVGENMKEFGAGAVETGVQIKQALEAAGESLAARGASILERAKMKANIFMNAAKAGMRAFKMSQLERGVTDAERALQEKVAQKMEFMKSIGESADAEEPANGGEKEGDAFAMAA